MIRSTYETEIAFPTESFELLSENQITWIKKLTDEW